MNKQLQDAVRASRSSITTVEKSGGLLPEHFEKIKGIKSDIIAHETLLEELIGVLNQSTILGRSPKVSAETMKFQKDLRDLKEKYDTLSRLAHKDTLTRDKYAAIEHYFLDQLTLTHGKLEAAERHRPSMSIIGELQSSSDKLHSAYDDMTMIINDEVDHHSDRYLEFSRDHRGRSNQLNVIDSKIHNFIHRHNQQREHLSRCEQRKSVLDSKIKATESQLDSFQEPKDNVQLQNNIIQLKSMIHDISMMDIELQTLANDVADNSPLYQSCHQLQNRVTCVKTKAEKTLRDSKNADAILKEHRHSVNVATDFLQQCQRRFESISTKSNNILQLESELQKLTDLVSSMDKNKPLISNCTNIAMPELKPLSDHGVEIIKLEIEQINKTFDDLEKSSLQSHNILESMIDQMRQKNDAYESLILWLRKKEKDLKAMDPIDGEESLQKDLEWLQSLIEEMSSKQGDIDLFAQHRPSPSTSNNLREKFDSVMEQIKKTTDNYNLILNSLRTFHTLLADWSHWIERTLPQRNTLSTMPDQERYNIVKGFLNDKDRKYEEMSSLVMKGETLIPRLSVTSGNHVKMTIKTVRDQWHAIFDDLTIMVDNLEEKIQNNATVKENIARIKSQFDRTRLLFYEEIHDLDPLRITFHIGTDEKGKQLMKLESILQTVVGLSYAVQKLETAVHTEEDSELEYETLSFVKEFTSFSDFVTRAKELSSESYKCHVAFEDSCAQANEAIVAIKNKLAICQSVNGTSMSLQSRLDRIQAILTKELINCDQHDEKIFTLLLNNRDRTETLMDDIERNIITERINMILDERKNLQQQTVSTRDNLENCFNDIDVFKTKYEALSKDIGMVRHLLQSRQDVDMKSLEVVAERINDVNQKCSIVEELALKILRNSNNELPIEMSKNLQRQTQDLASNLSQALNNASLLSRIQEDFDRNFEELKTHIEGLRMSFDDVGQRWNNSRKISDCESIFKEVNVLSSECLKADLLKEVLEKGLSKFHDFPEKLKKNTSRFSELSKDCSNLAEEFNEKRSSFENVIGEYKSVHDQLGNLQDDVKMYVISGKEGIPETKLGKCNLINDLQSQIEQLNMLKTKIIDVNTKSIGNKTLNECLTSEKIEMLKVIDANQEEAATKLNVLTKSLNDQEQLEKELSTIKESIYCVETSKISIASQVKLSGEVLEKKILEIDKNMGLISSIRRQIDQGLVVTRVGCYPEIEDLKSQRKRVDQIDQDFRSLRDQFSKEAKRILLIEDDVNDFDRFIQGIQEEMNCISEFGSSLESKKVFLEKGKDISERILEGDSRLQAMKEAICDVGSNDEGVLGIEKLFSKLEKQHNNLKIRISSIIDKHETSIGYSENFGSSYQEVIKEIFEVKSNLQNLDMQIKLNDIPNIENLKINVEHLMRLGENCLKSSSEEGKNLVSRRLEEAKKGWKNVEQIHKHMTIAVEKESHQFIKRENQKKHFQEWLNEIREHFNKIQSSQSCDINGKRKKHVECKGMLSEIQEWKKEVNQYFETTKVEKTNEVEMEMLKVYRTLLNDINSGIQESKLVLNDHLEFESVFTDFCKWLDATENKISESSPQSKVNVEEIDKELMKFHAMEMRIKDEDSKLEVIKNTMKKLLPNTSKDGQSVVSAMIVKVDERYLNVKKELQKLLKDLGINKKQLSLFEGSLKTFEEWLKTMEEKFTGRSLLCSGSEKQRKLKEFQGYLLSICNEKEKLDELTMELKQLPLNLTLCHCLRGVSGRYASLNYLAQSYVEQLARWEATHKSLSTIQGEFNDKSLILASHVKGLNDNQDGGINVGQLRSTLEEVDKKTLEVEELKVELESTLQMVLQETGSTGHDEIKKPFIRSVQRWIETQASLKAIKAMVTIRQGQENKMNQFTQNLRAWIDGVRNSVMLEFSQHVQIPSIRNNISLSDTLLQEVNRKAQSLSEIKGENSAVKDNGILKQFSDIDQDLRSLLNDLREKKSQFERLLEYHETYYNSLGNITHWIEEMNSKMKTLSINNGPEGEIDSKLSTVRDLRTEISSHGKGLIDVTIDSGNVFMKEANEKSDKEKILGEVDSVEQEYIDLGQRVERIEESLNAVSGQWKQFRRCVDELSRTVRKCQKKKQQLLDLKMNYGSDVGGGIEKLTELMKEITDEKLKSEIVLAQAHSLREISNESQVEVTVQDFLDQLNEQEIDCKYQLERLHQLNSEKTLFDQQYRQMNDWIQSMKTSLIEIDQLHDVPSFSEFQKHFSNFQLLEARIIVGDRLVDDCFQIGHRLSSFCDSDKDVNEIMKMLQNNWNNVKEKFVEIKDRLSKLLDLWAMLDHLYTLVDDWTVKVNKEVNDMVASGYVSEDVKDRCIRKLKEFESNADSMKPKLSKILELFHKADGYSAFTKRGDPLTLQKRFCDTIEMIKVFEKQLNYTQNNIDKFYQEVSDLEKLILNTSLAINNKYRITDTINSPEEVDNQLRFCLELKQQANDYEDDNMRSLIKLKDIISKQLPTNSLLKIDIDAKITLLSSALKQTKLSNDKWKQSLKQRSEKIKQYQKALHNAERLIYTDLPNWWLTKEITATMSPDDCQNQIIECDSILENIEAVKSEFNQVWFDYIHQRQLITKSQPTDSLSSQSFETLPESHLDEIKADFKEAKENVNSKLQQLRQHKEKWLQIENDIDDLESIFSNIYSEMEQMMVNQKDDDVLYSQFEDSARQIISKRDNLERLNEEINALNGNNDARSGYGTKYYKKYANLCQNYSGLIQKIDKLRGNLRTFNVRNSMKEILRTDLPNDFPQMIFPQFGTQTTRNKSSSIRTLKRFLSNPDLNDGSLPPSSTKVNDLRKSVDMEMMSKRIQTANDIGVQSRRSLSSNANKVMQGKKSFHKEEPLLNVSGEIRNQLKTKQERKEDRCRRLSDLLSTIQLIKEDVSTMHSYDSTRTVAPKGSRQRSPIRNSVESVRHNYVPINKKKPTKPKLRRSKSRESLGSRPSPTGCASPKLMRGESPVKRGTSPVKSPSKSGAIRQIAF